MRPSTLVAVILIVFVAVGAVVILSKLQPAVADTYQKSPHEPPIPQWAISFGKTDAPVLLIELFDLHCRYCAVAHEQLDPIYRELIEGGKLRLVFLDLIVHREAAAAHRLLHCAYRKLGNDTYELITQLYKVLIREGAGKQLELLKDYVCEDAPSEQDFNNAVRDLISYLNSRGVTIGRIGTPTFIVVKNGTINVVVGADVPKVKSLISR